MRLPFAKKYGFVIVQDWICFMRKKAMKQCFVCVCGGGAYSFIHFINVSTILHWNVFTFTTEYGEQYQLET